MKTVAIIAIVIAICIIGAGYYFVSGEKWGYDNTDINNLRFKLQIKFKDGSTTDINAPMTIMYDNKVIESIIYYAEIKGTSDVYNTFEVTAVGTHYTLTSKDATDRTDYIKDKTFYNPTKIVTYRTDGQWRALINQAFTTTFLGIDPDITPLTELPYGDYKVWLNGRFKYRYGSVDWIDFNMDSSSVVIHYAEDVVKIEVSGGTNLDNNDGDQADDTPDGWEPPEEDPSEAPGYAEKTIIIEQTEHNSMMASSVLWQSFNTKEIRHIDYVELKLCTYNNQRSAVLKLLDKSDEMICLSDAVSFKAPSSGTWVRFNINADVSRNQMYYLEFRPNGQCFWLQSVNNPYPDGTAFNSPKTAQTHDDFCFRIVGR